MENHAQNPEIFTLSRTGNPTPPKQPALETYPAGSLCRMAIAKRGITANAVWKKGWMSQSFPLRSSTYQQCQSVLEVIT